MRSGRVRRAAIALAGALVAMQVVRPAKTNPPVTADVGAPPDVAPLLRRACYDCHSHETRWPWYATVAPVSWLVVHDVNDGRRELNFSTWDAYDRARRRKKLAKSIDELDEGEMPPWYYTLMHGEARLSDGERAAVRAWASAARDAAARE